MTALLLPVSSLFVDRFHMSRSFAVSAEYVKEIAPPCARRAFTHGGDGAEEQGLLARSALESVKKIHILFSSA